MKKYHVCPWQHGSLLTISARKLLTNPRRITEPYISAGMTIMDIGCGMGFFTIPMSDIVGKQGKVIAVDLQPEMLEGMKKNAQKVGNRNITAHVCSIQSLNVELWNGMIDFALMFWMLHEVPDAERLIREIYDVLTPTGILLFAEPVVHVGREKYKKSLDMIKQSGFTVIASPKIPICRAAVLQKSSNMA